VTRRPQIEVDERPPPAPTPIADGRRPELTAAEWKLAKTVCTQKQLAVLDLWRKGAGRRRIALVLGIDETTAREHVRRGLAAIERAKPIRKDRPDEV
jgi:DNA-binding CsgD family transcriptional regulator